VSDLPLLPPQYDLVALETVDSVLEECRRRAENGAEEGLLIWAQQQTAAFGRFDQPWYAPPGNLHCAVLLRPEFPAEHADQLTYVTALSIGTALATLISPMAGLRYRWPNNVVMNDGKVAAIHLKAPKSQNGSFDWLAIGLSVNIRDYPEDTPFPALSVHAVDGSADITAVQVLEGYSRQLLSWLNRWANDGLPPILKAWSLRADDIGDETEIRLGSVVLPGQFVRLDSRGAMVLAQPEGIERAITVAEFLDLSI